MLENFQHQHQLCIIINPNKTHTDNSYSHELNQQRYKQTHEKFNLMKTKLNILKLIFCYFIISDCLKQEKCTCKLQNNSKKQSSPFETLHMLSLCCQCTLKIKNLLHMTFRL